MLDISKHPSYWKDTHFLAIEFLHDNCHLCAILRRPDHETINYYELVHEWFSKVHTTYGYYKPESSVSMVVARTVTLFFHPYLAD